MRVLFIRKTLKDIWNLKKQLFPIAFLILVGVSITVGLTLAKKNLVATEVNLEKQSNMANFYVTLSEKCSLENLEILNQCEYIDKCTIRKSVEGTIDSVSSKNVRIMTYDTDINIPIIYSGMFDVSDKNGIINQGFYRLNKEVEIGKRIDISVGENETSLNISGVFNTPEYLQGVHADFFRADYAAVIVSEQTFEEISEKNVIKYELLISKNTEVSDDEIIQYITSVLDDNEIIEYSSFQQLHSIETFYNVLINLILTQYKNIFLTFIICITAVLTALTMIRLIKTQNKSISLLKMLGYSNLQIKIQYFSIGFIVAGVASVLGLVIGRVLAKFIVDYYCVIFDLGNAVFEIYLWEILPALIVSMISVCISTYIAVHKLSKINPIILIKENSNMEIHYESKFNLEKILQCKSMVKKNAIRVLERHKYRFIASILITLLSSIILMLIFLLIDQDTFMEKEDKNFRKYEGSIIMQDLEERHKIMGILEKYGFKEYQLNFEEEVNVKLDNNESMLQLVVTENEMGANYVEDIDIREGVCISDTGAEILGLEIGDSVALNIQGKEYKVKIKNIFNYYRQCLVIPVNILDEQNSIKYNRIHFRMDNEQQKEIIEQYVKEQENFVGVNFQEDFWNQVEESNRITFSIYYVCIGLVALLNYFVIKIINNSTFQENQKAMITMRLLGVKLNDTSMGVNLNLILMYISITITTIFIVPWLLPLLQKIINISIFYKFNVSIKNVLYTQIIISIMFAVLYLKNVHNVRKLKLVKK